MVNTSFGGQWTQDKLDILRRYLDAYTTALKANAVFASYTWMRLPGRGRGLRPQDTIPRTMGNSESSTKARQVALEIQDKPFDRLVFVEMDSTRSNSLREKARYYPNRDIEVINDDANQALPRICNDLRTNDRAVVFLDPFATQVGWDSVNAIAQTKKVDCWILFPLMAIARMINNYEPDGPLAGIGPGVRGTTTGRAFIILPPSCRYLAWPGADIGDERIAQLYRDRLVDSKELQSVQEFQEFPMFELFFAASNPRGAPIAVNIADHILSNW